MDQILDGLFISNYRAARDEELLNRCNITHIVKLMLFAKPITTKQHYLCIKVNDTNKTNIAQYFAVCNDFIHNARLDDSKRNNVLVHCFMGLSRSVTVTIAYLMTVTDLGFDDAWRFVRSLRVGARPNLFFQKQLHDFEINQLMLERYRLRKRFPNSNLYVSDRLRCRAVLKDYELLLLERLRFNIDNYQVRQEMNSRATDTDDEDETLGNLDKKNEVSSVRLTLEQKGRLRRLAMSARTRRSLIPAGIELDMGLFKKEVLMPGAFCFTAVNGSKVKQMRENRKPA